MGYVWNVMLSFDNEELWEDDESEASETCEPLEKINAWLSLARLVSLTEPTYQDDVGNGMDANLYGGGFKHFDIVGFIQIVKTQNWKARSKVQLWVNGGEEGMGTAEFTLIKLGRNRSEAAVRAAATRKRRATAARPAHTKKQRDAGRKGAAAHKAK